AGVPVHQANVGIAAHRPRQVHGDAVQILLALVGRDVSPGDAGERDVAVLEDDLDAGRLVEPAADEEAAPRVRHRERYRRERALRAVALPLVAADPIFALVLAFHFAAALAVGVALERVSGGGAGLGTNLSRGRGIQDYVPLAPAERERSGPAGQDLPGPLSQNWFADRQLLIIMTAPD